MLIIFMEDLKMKQISIEDKTHIKQFLYFGYVLGIKGDQYKSFSGFQLWWYDRQFDVCNCCESHYADGRKQVRRYSLNAAANILWHNRKLLYVRSKILNEDKRLKNVGHYEYARQ